jgi:hypothetical protein
VNTLSGVVAKLCLEQEVLDSVSDLMSKVAVEPNVAKVCADCQRNNVYVYM